MRRGIARSRQAANTGFGIPGSLRIRPWTAELQKQRAINAGRNDPMPRSYPLLSTGGQTHRPSRQGIAYFPTPFIKDVCISMFLHHLGFCAA